MSNRYRLFEAVILSPCSPLEPEHSLHYKSLNDRLTKLKQYRFCENRADFYFKCRNSFSPNMYKRKLCSRLPLFLLLSSALLFLSFHPHNSSLNEPEQELYRRIMEYRKEKGLPAIALSPALNLVAKTHVKDLSENNPIGGGCNLHSWSSKGNWTACCYTPDHARADCIWKKPRELTSYTGNGYEIAHYSSAGATPSSALEGWKRSSGHNEVMINGGRWAALNWKAIGIAIYKEYAVVWFGEEEDKSTN